jgi:hypothetical protein
VLSLNDTKFVRNMENCIKYGSCCILEDVDMNMDTFMRNILEKKFVKKGSVTYLKVGDGEL